MESNATIRTAALYIQAGFVAPFPLREGAKFPPAKGFTGNAPSVTKDDLYGVWGKVSERANRNMAIRLQVHSTKGYDIISLDVDDYGDKHGEVNIRELEAQLGDLSRKVTPRSSRRGAQSPSGQYFYKVPKGLKWAGKVCDDVEVVQMTHRYAAVWPSVVDDMQYKWYVGTDEVSIPNTDDLPELPDSWIAQLASQ